VCLELTRLRLARECGPPHINYGLVKSMYYVGVDIAKRNHQACLLDEQGSQLLMMSFANTAAGGKKLLEAVSAVTKPAVTETEFCMEATGHYWLPLYCFLRDQGFEVHVINPIQSDSARNLYIRKSKTDKKDAFILADLLRMNRVTSTKLAEEPVLKLQTLSRTRSEFVSQVGALKSRVLGILDRIFPEYERFFSNVFIKTSRELLKSFTTPDELATIDLSELTEFLAKHSRGRIGYDRAQKIQSYAQASFGISIGTDAFALQLRLLLAQVEFIEEQIAEIEEAIEQVMEELRACQDQPYRHVIETVPGIGPVLAAAIIGEIGDIERFPNARKLVAYAGIDATTRQSGQFEGTRNRMSKRGSPYLRHALWLAAVSARRFNPQLREYFQEKLAEGKHPYVATGAVARKLLHLIYALWSQNRPYETDYTWHPPEH